MNIENQNDNVFLFGAGASWDAEIPLLGNFPETMNTMAFTGRGPDGPLDSQDTDLLRKAGEITGRLDTYHGRVSLNQFDLEQVLSVLALEGYLGDKQAENDLAVFTQAISRTVEITCRVRHNGHHRTTNGQEDSVFERFWDGLFQGHMGRGFVPPILSFNYDLVMERALLQRMEKLGPVRFCIANQVPGIDIRLLYHEQLNRAFSYEVVKCPALFGGPDTFDGKLQPEQNAGPDFIKVPILKLHGSLNFSSDSEAVPEDWSLVRPVEKPFIVPPVFNKATNLFASEIWKAALESLRSCKHLIICGYSLPTTDTYMQYFFKTALEPNRDLQKIFVFDPLLFRGTEGDALRQRYQQCFSKSFINRIHFNPPRPNASFEESKLGTFQHLSELVLNRREKFLFGVA